MCHSMFIDCMLACVLQTKDTMARGAADRSDDVIAGVKTSHLNLPPPFLFSSTNRKSLFLRPSCNLTKLCCFCRQINLVFLGNHCCLIYGVFGFSYDFGVNFLVEGKYYLLLLFFEDRFIVVMFVRNILSRINDETNLKRVWVYFIPHSTCRLLCFLLTISKIYELQTY